MPHRKTGDKAKAIGIIRGATRAWSRRHAHRLPPSRAPVRPRPRRGAPFRSRRRGRWRRAPRRPRFLRPPIRLDWWRRGALRDVHPLGPLRYPGREWSGRTDYGEWIRNNARIPIDVYDRFQARFNPTRFDPDAWVRMAKAAGMQYIVITTKHHDGFRAVRLEGHGMDVMAAPYAATSSGNWPRRAGAEASGWASTTRSWTGTIPTTCRGADWGTRVAAGSRRRLRPLRRRS